MPRNRLVFLWIPTLLGLLAGGFVLATYRADLPLPLLVEKYTNEASRFMTVNGVRVHYRDEGAGQVPLVLLHGTGASLHTWDGWTEVLGHDFRVIRPDLPGFGLTGPVAGGDYTIQAYVEFVDAFLNGIDIGRVHLAGNSLGGQIAWNYALLHPERVDKLVLLDAAGYPRDEPAGKSLVFRLSTLPGINRLFEHLTPRTLVADSLHEVYGDPSRVTDALIDRYYELSLRPGNRRAFVERALDSGNDRNGDHRLISHPTLIMWGAEDRWISLADARGFTADISKSRLIVYPGVGHVPMEELPGPTARAALSFLRD